MLLGSDIEVTARERGRQNLLTAANDSERDQRESHQSIDPVAMLRTLTQPLPEGEAKIAPGTGTN